MTLVDSHCHLNYPGLKEDVAAVLARARQCGVDAFVNIGTEPEKWDEVHSIAEAHDKVWCSIGVHPHEAEKHADLTLEALLSWAEKPKVIAFGETGLDYYYEHSPRDEQKRLFRLHIEASRRTGLPLIVHTRDAEDDTLEILRDEMGKGAFPALIHCFTASEAFGKACIDLGLYLSFSGIVTFKKAENVQASAKDCPLDRMLVETDSPYLAPVPHRGKPCEPAYTADTARFIAGLRTISPEELARATTANFFRLFRKAAEPCG